ncbi:transposase [Pseudoflavonifractor sp. MSJ-37]|uniref:transposase n=1 Tax=Pseudoflavonifractor sp. MSJ-37 TaxID=2841531 RepID=UPI001C0FE405|nr:transposase [Pseudoflavonifractor sp. MSJ-37]MBU5434022.1 transposase [Pseudoflavonifractor sp. MSJ-37]
MAKRSTTPTCCLTLPLKLEKWQEDRLAKRFEIARQIYNTLVHAEWKKLRQVERSARYRELQAQIRAADPKNDQEKKARTRLYKEQAKLLKDAGFTDYAFKSDIKYYYKHFNENIGSNVAMHGIAPQVWAAFEKKLFKKDGKKVHYKRFGELRSLRGYSVTGKSGGVEIRFHGTYIEWKGLKLPLKLDPKNDYEAEMLSHRVKYVRLLRKPGRSKDRWYAQLSLEGIPAVKRDQTTGEALHPVGHGPVGLDIGPQTLAYSAAGGADLIELADQVTNIEREKRRMQRRLERSRRAANPDNYDTDGTIKRGVKLTHNRSKRYRRIQRELAYLQHSQAETRKRQHIALANHLLTLGDCFYVEAMEWSSLAHRAKKTEVSEKTGRIKRKKRFGRSIGNKAPASLIGILRQKCISLGLPGVVEVPTSLRASQYDHLSDTYTKKELSQRWNDMPDGRQIQRDLYSAFLLEHCIPETAAYDKDALRQDYPRFIRYHDQTIQRLAAMPKTIASMGIRRTRSEQIKPV